MTTGDDEPVPLVQRRCALGAKNPDTDPILGDLGCVAVPEFGTKFVRGMVKGDPSVHVRGACLDLRSVPRYGRMARQRGRARAQEASRFVRLYLLPETIS